MTQPLRYAQLQVAVADLDVAVEAYRRVFRLEVEASGVDPEEGARWLDLGAAGEGSVRLLEPTARGPLADVMERRSDERNPGGGGLLPVGVAHDGAAGGGGGAGRVGGLRRAALRRTAASRPAGPRTGVRFEIAPRGRRPALSAGRRPLRALAHRARRARPRSREIATFQPPARNGDGQRAASSALRRSGVAARGARRPAHVHAAHAGGTRVGARAAGWTAAPGREHPEGEGVHVVVFGVPDLAAGAEGRR